MGKTSIEWTAGDDGTPGKSWNPLRARHRETGKTGWACVHVSQGCTHCYSEAFNRYRGTGLRYRAQDLKSVETFLDPKTLAAPLSWKKPCRCFVCSMTDLFAEWVPFEQIAAIFGVMAACPHVTFQCLTKRPKRAREFFQWEEKQDAISIGECAASLLEGDGIDTGCGGAFHPDTWPLPNVWLGTSCEDQETADKRIPDLLACPATVRFVSYEPALGPVDLTRLRPAGCSGWVDALGRREHRGPSIFESEIGLDWVIIGGESGPAARPFDVAWPRDVIAQCRSARVAVFVKQIGARPIGIADYGAIGFHPRDRKGGDMEQWPADLRVREFPEAKR